MMRAHNLHRSLLSASVQSEDCTSTRYWRLAVSCDEGDYVNVGGPINTNGHQIIRTYNGGLPLQNVGFHTIKPRLTLTNDSETAPPLLRGKLTITFAERPEQIEEVQAVVLIDRATQWDRLMEYVGHGTDSRVRFSLPGDQQSHWGFVTNVQRQDLKADSGGFQESAQLTIQLWDEA